MAEFVSRLAIQNEDPVGLATAALLVYRLLESQAEADMLKQQLAADGPFGSGGKSPR